MLVNGPESFEQNFVPRPKKNKYKIWFKLAKCLQREDI